MYNPIDTTAPASNALSGVTVDHCLGAVAIVGLVAGIIGMGISIGAAASHNASLSTKGLITVGAGFGSTILAFSIFAGIHALDDDDD